jgi:hypothetical protein
MLLLGGSIKFNFNDSGTDPHWNVADKSAVSNWGYNGTSGLKMWNNSSTTNNYLFTTLDANKIKGRVIKLSALVKMDGVTTPPNPWNGIKVQLKLTGIETKPYNLKFDYNLLYSATDPDDPPVSRTQTTHGWRFFSREIAVPNDITNAELILGLEQASGTVYYDNINIKVIGFCFNFNETDNGPYWWNSVNSEVITDYNNTPSLKVTTSGRYTNSYVSRNFTADEIDDLKGKSVRLNALVKVENVLQPLHSWNGIKVQLKITSTNAGVTYKRIQLNYGSYDWGKYFSKDIELPHDLTELKLLLGLEKTQGTVYFDDVKLQVINFRGDNLPPQLRGVMFGSGVKLANKELARFDIDTLTDSAKQAILLEQITHDLNDLAAWDANLIRFMIDWSRYPLVNSPNDPAMDIIQYRNWINLMLPVIDHVIAECRRLNIKILLDLHTVPGARNKYTGQMHHLLSSKVAGELFYTSDSGEQFFYTVADNPTTYREELVSTWELLATRYKNDGDVIFAYDILNEPVEPTTGIVPWFSVAATVIEAIRNIDPIKAIVYESGPFGDCDNFNKISPLPYNRIIYSFHMYKPNQFTHQTLNQFSNLSYPGTIPSWGTNPDYAYYDKAKLDETMLPAINFSIEHDVQIIIGEFSAIRWAPNSSAYNYLKDVTELFEAHGWDWAYHFFRAPWTGWSVEHDTVKTHTTPTVTPTPRFNLLGNWFDLNQFN